VQWLLLSVLLSLVLTVALNVAVRVFPGARRAARCFDELGARHADGPRGSSSRVRTIAPWKTMLAVSIALTVALNLLLWAR
jgi:hypothetical protein